MAVSTSAPDLLRTAGEVEHRYFVSSPEHVITVVKESPSTGGERRASSLHTDALASVEVVTDEHGELVETRSYDAFGKRRAAPWDKTGPLPARGVNTGYTGHEDEEDLGLVNMKGRLYDPTLGRFLTPDPFVTRPLNGQSWNRYSYVLNNPLAYTDPSGFDAAPANNAFPPPGSYHIEQSGGTVQVSATEDEIVIVGTAIEDEEEPPSLEALQAGAATTPVDLGTRGTVPGVTAPAAPTPGSLKSAGEIAGEVFHGSLRGLGELAVEMAKSTVLNIATAGLYGGYGLASSIWHGYQEDGVLGAVNVLNPLYGLGRLGAEASMAAENGDYEAAAAAGVKVVVLTAAAVLGGIEEGAALEGGAAGGGGRSRPGGPYVSRYADGTLVRASERPPHVSGPLLEVNGAPHSVLRWDTNGRLYGAKEFGNGGIHPTRDMSFTQPTFPNGTPRPGHLPPPTTHPYLSNPSGGTPIRGPEEPLTW